MRLRTLFAPFLLVILFAFMFLLSSTQLQAKEEAPLTTQAHSENVESVIHTANQSQSSCDNSLVPNGVGIGAEEYGHEISADYVQEAICAAYLRNARLLGNPRDNGSGVNVHWWRDHQGNASDYQVQDFESNQSDLGAVIIYNPAMRSAFVVRDGIWNHYAYTLDGVNGSLGGPVTDEMEYSWLLSSYPIHYFMKGFIVWGWESDSEASAIMYDDIPWDLPDATFRDVPEDHLFYEFIKNIEEQEVSITRGCYDDQEGNRFFCPESPITRGQLALMLARVIYRMDDEDLPDYSDRRFRDSNGDVFSRAAETLARDDIVFGYQNSNDQQVFGYNESATRGQAIAMIIRALQLPNDEIEHPFQDIDGNTFETEIIKGYHYGIISGCSNNKFCPDEYINRGAAAKSLCIAFLHDCDPERPNELRQNSWVYASPGIRVRGHEQQDVRMAVASLDNPYVQIEMAGDYNTNTNLFTRHIFDDLAPNFSNARNNGRTFPFVAINGTGFNCNGSSAASVLRVRRIRDSWVNINTIDITSDDNRTTEHRISFFRLGSSSNPSLPEIFNVYDSRCGPGDECQPSTHGNLKYYDFLVNGQRMRGLKDDQGNEVNNRNLVTESQLAVGFERWNSIVYNGNVVVHQWKRDELDREDQEEQKTAIGLSKDRKKIFLTTANADVSLNDLATQLITAGAHQAVLLDGGGSSQFKSHGLEENITQLDGWTDWGLCPRDGPSGRRLINAIVAYYGRTEHVRNLAIEPNEAGSFPTRDGVTFAFDSDAFVNARQATPTSNSPYTVTLHYAPQPTTDTYQLRQIGRFYEVSATYTDGSPAIPRDTYTVTVDYNPHRLPSTIDENNLALYHWNGTKWELEPTSLVDTEADHVTANPSNFGFWTVLALGFLEQITTNSPSYAGAHNNPSKIIVRVTKPSNSLTKSNFSVTVQGAEATVVTLHEGSDEYVLEVLPPTQSANGLYDLDVSVTAGGITLSDLEQDAVLYSESNNIDVALVIDRSGSMGTDYMQSAQNAAKQFVDFMFDNDQVGVVSFSNSARVDFGLAPVTSGAGGSREQAKNAIDALTSGGGTSIGGGLEQGQNELTSKGAATHPWAMVLLSDGAQNQEPLVADVLPDIVTTKTIVHTVALGPQSDQALLLDIATQTGGTYNLAPTAEQLQEVYNTIAGTVSGQQALLTQTGIVRTGETDEKSVVVDSTISEATFSVRWSNSASNLALELTAPDGTVINPTVAASTSDMVYVPGSTYAYYRIKSPTLSAGVWKMKITGGIISGSRAGIHSADPEEQYTAEVTGQPTGAAVTINSYFDDGTTYQTDDPILVSITLSDDQPILGAEVVAIVGPLLTGSSPARTVDQQTDPILVLYDDGAHGDGQANDGVYANILAGDNTATPGLYSFQIFATGTANNGESFARRTQQNVNVGVSQNPISANRQAEGLNLFLPLIMD